MDNKPESVQDIPLMNSPLLSQPVIQRDYKQGIPDQQTSQPQQQAPEYQQEPESPPQPETLEPETLEPEAGGQQQTGEQTQPPPEGQPPPPPPDDDTPEFKFDIDDGDKPESEAEPFKIPNISAKQFADISVDAYGIHTPNIFHQLFSKVAIDNIRLHVNKGNLHPQFVDVFQKVNANSLEAGKLTDEELELLKRSLKEYLKFKNAKFANPETAFWATLAMTVTRQTITAIQKGKENKDLVMDAIRMSNPQGFNTRKDQEEATVNMEGATSEDDDKKKPPKGNKPGSNSSKTL